MADIEQLLKFKDNIADKLDDDQLGELQQAIINGYEVDIESRAAWEKKMKEALELAILVHKEKSFPFKNAASVIYPMIATASIQFAARAYPNFVQGTNVVKGRVIGSDPTGLKAGIAQRVSEHMSYQCLQEMEEWEEETDKLLTVLPILGVCFKKTWFSKVLKRNVSEYRSPQDIVINYYAKSMSTVPRITEKFYLYPNEILERQRNGVFRDIKITDSIPTETKGENEETSGYDPDAPHLFIEQHTYHDLDGDGYKEPYISTLHKDTGQLVRIIPRFKEKDIERVNKKISRIKPTEFYTKFPFMPSPDGSIYDWGFGSFLSPINQSVNTALRQLLDAGTLSNLQAGFMGNGLQLGRGRGGGKLVFEPGEWKRVGFTGDDIRKNLMLLPTKEPSTVMFNLLSFLISAGDRLSSVTELFSGEQSNANERPTTTLARIEQGLKVFSAIHKRLYRSFKQEYGKLFMLNSEFLNPEEYFRILDTDTPMTIYLNDYNKETCDVIPVADPNETSNAQKLTKAQFLMELQGRGLNDQEINKRILEAAQIPDIEKILTPPPPPPPPPEIMLKQAQLELERKKFMFDVMKFEFESEEIDAKIQKTIAQSIESIARAESYEIGPQLERYKKQIDVIMHERKLKVQEMKGNQSGNNQGTVPKMASEQGNQGGLPGVSGT